MTRKGQNLENDNQTCLKPIKIKNSERYSSQMQAAMRGKMFVIW